MWLVPEAAQQDRLAALVEGLAARCGTPSFVPHVTLLGGLDAKVAVLERALVGLAACQPPLGLPALGATGHDEYFRRVVVELEATPELLRLRERALARLGAGSGRRFAPHLSLVYGWLPDSEAAALAGEIAPELPAAIRCDTVALVRTQGPPAAWREVVRHALAPRGLG